MASYRTDQLIKYYNHLIELHREAKDVLWAEESPLAEAVVIRLLERYLQGIIDDIAGLDKEYDWFVHEYASKFSSGGYKMTFLANAANTDWMAQITGFGKARNMIVHSPWEMGPLLLEKRLGELLICVNDLLKFLSANWICRNCQNVNTIDGRADSLEIGAKYVCEHCQRESGVVWLRPLLLEDTPSDFQLGRKVFQEGQMWYESYQRDDGKFATMALKWAIQKFKQAKEYSYAPAARELGLSYFNATESPEDQALALPEWKLGAEWGDLTCNGLIAAFIDLSQEETNGYWEKYCSGEIEAELAARYIMRVAESGADILHKEKLVPIKDEISAAIQDICENEAGNGCAAALQLLESLDGDLV